MICKCYDYYLLTYTDQEGIQQQVRCKTLKNARYLAAYMNHHPVQIDKLTVSVVRQTLQTGQFNNILESIPREAHKANCKYRQFGEKCDCSRGTQ